MCNNDDDSAENWMNDFGKNICLEGTALTPEHVNAAKEQLRFEAEEDQRYFAGLHKLLKEREKIIYAELKSQFVERMKKGQREQRND